VNDPEPSRPSVLLDTSVLVAALVAAHPHHGVALPYLVAAHREDARLVVAAHALAELFATLTAMPLAPRVVPGEAEQMIQRSVLAHAEVQELTPSDYVLAILRMASLGLGSGAVYDALHVVAAERAGADELVTLNGRDFRRMPPAAPCRLVVLR
jgi:predicted nucleic acid-binding protein